jgi:hypothetical protein
MALLSSADLRLSKGNSLEPKLCAVQIRWPGPRTSDSILSHRKASMDEAGLDQPQSCLKIVVKGRKNGEVNCHIFSMSSRGQGMGEGTGIPAQIVCTGECRGAQPQPTSYQPSAMACPSRWNTWTGPAGRRPWRCRSRQALPRDGLGAICVGGGKLRTSAMDPPSSFDLISLGVTN